MSLKNNMRKIYDGICHDPHAVLGMHENKDLEKVVRVFQPEATTVSITLLTSKKKLKLEHADLDGFWDVTFTSEAFEKYEVHVEYADENKFDYIHPYQFMPHINEEDAYLFGKGDHHFIYEKLGAHVCEMDGIKGVAFAVWAPAARRVSVVGDFNLWDGRKHMMRVLGSSGIWEIFIPGVDAGQKYKFEIYTRDGQLMLKADPYANMGELRPGNASRIYESNYKWKDKKYMSALPEHALNKAMSIYEVHLASWKRKDDWEWYTYKEIAPILVDYVKKHGFTHIELMPVMEYPFDASWGYQVTGYYAPTSRFGDPDDLRYFIDYCHKSGIGVLLDWVPAHFPKDAFSLAQFDGTALYEHADPRKGEHPDWGTLIFNYGRNEVSNFLISNALYWIKEFHVDGLRIDAVASMLYLDYSRKEGEWIPNQYGGNENLEAIEFMKKLSTIVGKYFPKALMIAEESTAWGGVSHPVHTGGLGFDFKWNMGWMNDFLRYMEKEPIHRKYHHSDMTFSMLYQYSENFILSLSHDEVVHGKGSLLNKMPGDDWQKFANYKLLLAFMFCHPGKKLLFMGTELAPWGEWNEERGIEWELEQYEPHRTAAKYMTALNKFYTSSPSLWERDQEPAGFAWIDGGNMEQSIASFFRRGNDLKEDLIVVCNFTPETYFDYRLGVPEAGNYKEVFNSDNKEFNGSGVIKNKEQKAENIEWNGRKQSIQVGIPPLSCVIFKRKDLSNEK
ncbi:MAG: 1,4-alpha-glucan branching protein GlgB [Candidatus Marinimicrobia bacterium]|nr:1,4-alpha-glucan branching protein GlgB [Candidatus Neomarinimicrobiota bacterium]